MIRAIIIISVLLAGAIGYIAWREATLAQGVSTAEQDAILAEMENQFELERDALEEKHAEELAALTQDLTNRVNEAKEETERVRVRLTAERNAAMAKARKSAEGLKAAVVQASGAKPSDVRVTAVEVAMSIDAALKWVDLTFELQNNLVLSESICAEKLTQQELDLVPPLVEQIQGLKEDNLWKDQGLKVSETKETMLESRLRDSQSDVLTWSLVSGGVALAVGIIVGLFTDRVVKE